MSAVKYLRKRPIIALLAVALCAVLAVSAAAQGKSYRPAERSTISGGNSDRQESRGSRQSGSSYRPADPSPSSRNTGTPRTSGWTGSRSGSPSSTISRPPYRPGSSSNSGYRTTSTYPTTPSYRTQPSRSIDSGYRTTTPTYSNTPSYRPAPSKDSNSGRDSSTTYRSRGYSPTPSSEIKGHDRKPSYTARKDDRTYSPSSSNGHSSASYHRDDRPVVRRYQYVPVPTSYKPPTYRSGYYYYSHSTRNRPCHYGYWSFVNYAGFCRRSVYYHYGFYPYIEITRVVEVAYPTVTYVNTPIYVNGGYYLEKTRYAALDEALADIRSAWIGGRFDLVERHVRPNDRIAVLLDGSYDYSIDGDDYLRMTEDAIGDMQTASFVWDSVRERSDGNVTAFGTHRYYGSSGDIRTVYVSYTLQKIGQDYYIWEVGSSDRPLR